MKLITPDEISMTARISEAELRDRLEQEMLTQINGCDAAGRPLPGVEVRVERGRGKSGGYTITATGPAPKRLALPAEDDLTP